MYSFRSNIVFEANRITSIEETIMSPYVVATMLIAAMVFTGVTPAPECPVNQIWELCGTMCEPTCSVPDPNPEFCPRLECTQYTAACRCQRSYYRKDDGSCVPFEDC